MTEMIQFFLLTAGLLVVMVTALGHSGGFDNIVYSQAASQTPDYFNLVTSFPANLAYIIGFSLAFVIDGSIWQRLSASRNPNDARKASGLALIIFIPLFAFVSITGIAAAGMFGTLPEGGVVITLVTDYLPASLGAIVFIGVAAAIMSTMCTALNASALYISELYEKYVQRELSNRGSVRVGVISTVAACALGFIVAIRLQDALAVLSIASNILAAGAFVPVMGGFIWRRATSSGAIACMIGGGGFVLYDYLGRLGLPFPTFWQEESTAIILGVAIGLVLYVGVSLCTKAQTAKHDAFVRSAGLKEVPKAVATGD
jgi:SSS family solute:Na+ symporter